MSRAIRGLLYTFVWVVVAFASTTAWAAFRVPPQPNSPVYDGADVLTPEQERSLAEKLSSFRDKHGASVVVALLPSLEGESIKEVSYEIAAGWGIGKGKQNDGVLLLISVAEATNAGPGAKKCGCVRIEVGEYLEGALTDALSLKILRELLPAVVSGEFEKASNEGIEAIFKALNGEGAALNTTDEEPAEGYPDLPWWAWILIVVCLLWLASKGIFVFAFFDGSGGGGGGSSGGSSFGGGSFGGGGADL